MGVGVFGAGACCGVGGTGCIEGMDNPFATSSLDLLVK